MSFAVPSLLMWLVPLMGAIVALYLLKMRRKDFVVPATFLWPSMTFEVRANSLFQRLRLSLLLFLQLLAVALLVLALSRPQVRQRGLSGDLTVLVLDTSASMSAREGNGTRFDRGIAACRKLIDAVGAGDRLSLVEAGPNPRVVFPISSDPGKMRQALQSVRATDADCDVGEALRLAASIAAKHRGARIVLVSDGVFPEVHDFSPGNAKLEFVPIGGQGENVGITALSASPSSEGLLVFCGLRNYGKKPVALTVDLIADGKLFNSKKLQLDGGGTFGETFAAPPKASVLEAKINPEDALVSDNRAFALADPGASVRALLVGKGDLFLERALVLDPRVTLDRASVLPREAASGEPLYDVVVFDGVPEAPTTARGVLVFGTAGPQSPVRAVGVQQNPRVRSQRGDHPVMAAVDMLNTYIDRAERVEAKPTGQVLATGSSGPLIVVSDGPPRRLYVAFEPMNSDFPLQVAFPIFIANALDYLAPREASGSALLMPPGRSFTVPATSGQGELELRGPGGIAAKLASTGGVWVVRDAVRTGEYTMTVGGKERVLLVGPPPETESAIAPRNRVLAGGQSIAGSDSVLRLADYWRWLAMLGLLVLGCEWWLFARRS